MIILIVIGMSLATMIPRFIPAFIVDKFVYKEWVNRWLQAIPYAALGALIFPAILSVKEGEPHIGLLGGVTAIILSLFGLNIIVVIVGAIATVYFLSL